jgi:hypothetical protein
MSLRLPGRLLLVVLWCVPHAAGMTSRWRMRAPPLQQPPQPQPPSMSGQDFWAKKLGARGGLEPAANFDARTPEAALTEAMSTGDSNRRPDEQRAQQHHDTLKHALLDFTAQPAASTHHQRSHLLPPRKRPRRGAGPGSGGKGGVVAVAPRSWDTALQVWSLSPSSPYPDLCIRILNCVFCKVQLARVAIRM